MAIQVLPVVAVIGAGGAIGLAVSAIKDLYDSKHFNSDGYNNLGFDRRGFDRDGFDEKGYDREGFNKDGYDAKGYSREGYNAEGFDRRGYDREGWNTRGYDRDGFDRAGYNSKGFNRKGWNENGFDVTGHDAAYYAKCVSDIEARVSKAKEFMSARDYEHVSLEVRKGAELAVKCVISHTKGVQHYRRHLATDIDTCKNTFNEDMISKLHSLRQICSDQLHIDESDHDNWHAKLYFSIKTLEETLPQIREYAAAD